ncbi:hypothetical protein EYF80_047010 [Liparis tanakae]|uniref:Uncharacterized protein n=1 Tax=Liparis tanakae TaxID=230148 RepID=A0A4Z2FPL9_9TELE|nr:hypothetical protein EYF80_047010 [Liparis tanakae]
MNFPPPVSRAQEEIIREGLKGSSTSQNLLQLNFLDPSPGVPRSFGRGGVLQTRRRFRTPPRRN